MYCVLRFCSVQVGEGVVVDCLLLLLDHYTHTHTPSQEQLQHFSAVFSRPVSHPVLSEQVGAGRSERLPAESGGDIWLKLSRIAYRVCVQ